MTLDTYERIRLSKQSKAALKRQAKARGKQLGFSGKSAYIRWLIARDGDRIAAGG